MSQQKPAPNIKRLVIFGSMALCFPIFLVTMAYFAVSNDAQNQQRYKQQQEQHLANLQHKKAAQQVQSDEQSTSSAVHSEVAEKNTLQP